MQAIEAVDRNTLHALIFWDGKRWLWRAQGMEGDETLMPPPKLILGRRRRSLAIIPVS